MRRVLISAPSPVVRAGLEAIVRTDSNVTVVGAVPTTSSLSAAVASLHPDVLVMELEAGDTALHTEIMGNVALPALILSDDLDVAEALRRGVRGVLPRETAPEEIVAAVEAVAAGLMVLHPDHAPLGMLPIGSHTPLAEELTPREVEVLGMLAEGAGNKAIARRLAISEHTVKFHVGSILAKLNAASRTEAVTLGIRQGLIVL